ncbi:predicted protein [Lichtheimia corymbifera JMRC:FSU:9682]|uniref:Uncharacterized protein n=1 Tax=Lichtheimia corymbifera JMRC:FSU:9682 TaxID=1263082 RepID=A0A068S769_9FUNG|nr:predicted protein [Lichtheimia corymbifera JMRC:FSU:9682]
MVLWILGRPNEYTLSMGHYCISASFFIREWAGNQYSYLGAALALHFYYYNYLWWWQFAADHCSLIYRIKWTIVHGTFRITPLCSMGLEDVMCE